MFTKTIKAQFIICIIIIFLLESVAFFVNKKFRYKEKLLTALSAIEPINEPVKASSSLPWTDNSLLIRIPSKNNQEDIYIIGGRQIPNANPNASQALITPKNLENKKQKNIFIIGGSSAFGYPYRINDSFGFILEHLIKNQNYKVINASQPGWTV